MKKIASLLLAATAAALMGACSNFGCLEADTSASALLDKTWTPTELAKQGTLSAPEGRDMAFITFTKGEEPAKIQVNGYAGDNGFFGSASLEDGGKISFGPLATTLKLGQNTEYEYMFLKTLNEAKGFEVCADTLLLEDADGNVLAKFKQTEKPER